MKKYFFILISALAFINAGFAQNFRSSTTETLIVPKEANQDVLSLGKDGTEASLTEAGTMDVNVEKGCGTDGKGKCTFAVRVTGLSDEKRSEERRVGKECRL